MARAELIFLPDKGDSGVGEGILYLLCLMSDDHDGLFRLQVLEGELQQVAQHRSSQKGMEDLDQVGTHPLSHARGQDDNG